MDALERDENSGPSDEETPSSLEQALQLIKEDEEGEPPSFLALGGASSNPGEGTTNDEGFPSFGDFSFEGGEFASLAEDANFNEEGEPSSFLALGGASSEPHSDTTNEEGFPSLEDFAFDNDGFATLKEDGMFEAFSLVGSKPQKDEEDEASAHHEEVVHRVTHEESEESEEEFSLLELRDRVVIMMSFKQLVTAEKIESVWRKWKEAGEIDAPEISAAAMKIVVRPP